MVVLGLSDTRDRAAAAVSVDGQLVAAVAEAALTAASPRRPASSLHVGQDGRHEPPDLAIRFGLSRAVASVNDITAYAYADETRWADADLRAPGRETIEGQVRVWSVAAGHAAAALAAAALPDTATTAHVIVCDSSQPDAGGIYHRGADGRLTCAQALRGAGRFMEAAQTACQLLGLPTDDTALDALAELAFSSTSDDGAPLTSVLRTDDGAARFDRDALLSFIAELQEHAPGPLSAGNHPHLEVQRLRRLAASRMIHTLSARLTDIVRTADPSGTEALAFGGSLFTSPRFNSHLATQLARAVAFSPVPEPAGLAAGAALAASTVQGAPLAHVALGPSFTEDDIKATLENCRIDFVYEPSWDRLLARTSHLLARGKVVAWFQGRLDFGPRSLGSRSILCDPSNRYARHNINEYLLGRALDAPLAVSLASDDAEGCLDEGLVSPFMLRRGQFRDGCQALFRSALDGGRGCTVHTSGQSQSSELRDLLAWHKTQTGVPGLIHHPLRLGAGPLAASPRAALQAFFSSAIDALVIGRFLLMKDHWLLRSDS